MANILFLIIPIVAINAILLVFYLTKKISHRQSQSQQPEAEQPKSEQPNQQSEAPTTPRKIPIGIIATILIIAIPLGIIFLIPGDTSDRVKSVIEKGKVMATGKPEISVLEDNFNRQELGENWQLGIGKWYIENGELVGGNAGLDAWIHLKPVFEADKITITFDAWIESKEWKPKTEIGCYFYDEGNENDYYPILLFDGQANIFDKTDNPLWQPFATGMLRSNKIYRIKATRNQQQEKVCLSLVVSDENGKIIANNNKKINSGRERVKIGFFSFNVINHSEGSENKIHINNLKIHAYTTT